MTVILYIIPSFMVARRERPRRVRTMTKYSPAVTGNTNGKNPNDPFGISVEFSMQYSIGVQISIQRWKRHQASCSWVSMDNPDVHRKT